MKRTIKVKGMSCEHCVAAVERAVTAIPGVGRVEVDLAGGNVTFEHEETVSLAVVKDAIEEQGYEVV